MEHSHHHHHHNQTLNVNRAFIIGISLNLLYILVQLFVGFKINSLALLSDAGHNFLDVAGLALSLLAFKLAKSKSNIHYTFGYKKASIIVSLINAIILLLSIGAIGFEALFRFANPQTTSGTTIMWVSVVGIFINGGSAFLFFEDKEKDINIKSAFLHLAADAMISVGMVVGGFMISKTNWFWIDPLFSIIICLIILWSTWRLLKVSMRLSLDGVPENVSIEEIEKTLTNFPNVSEVHHIHIWPISTNENAMTAHIKLDSDFTLSNLIILKHDIKHELLHLNIHHVTIEFETTEEDCKGDCLEY